MKGWRTIAAFAASAIVYLLGWEQLKEILDPKWIAIGGTVMGVVMRLVTTGPVGKKD